jgi:hypothetical protein
MSDRTLLLVSGVLSSAGGFFLLTGAFVQARILFGDYCRGRPREYDGELHFWPSFRQLSFAGENGWTLVLVGGALVFAGSVVATVVAARGPA